MIYDQEILHMIQSSSTDEIIEHFGIKGMKWGFRKSSSKGGSKKRKKSDRGISRSRYKKWNKKYRNRMSISDRDLKKSIERLRLENDFGEQIDRANSIRKGRGQYNRDGYMKELGKMAVNSAVSSSIKSAAQVGAKHVYGQLTGNKRAPK